MVQKGSVMTPRGPPPPDGRSPEVRAPAVFLPLVNAVQVSHTTGTLVWGSAPGAARESRLRCSGNGDTFPHAAGSPPAAAAQQTRHLPVRGHRAVGRGLTGRPAPVLGSTPGLVGLLGLGAHAGPASAGHTTAPKTCSRRSGCTRARERGCPGSLSQVAGLGSSSGSQTAETDAELFTTSGCGNRLAGPTQRGGRGHSDSESVDLYLKSKLPLMKGSASKDTALL